MVDTKERISTLEVSATREDIIQASKAVHDEMKGYVKKELESAYRKSKEGETTRLERLEKKLERVFEARLKTLTAYLVKRIEDAQQAYERSLSALIESVKSLPPPVVNVPQSEPKVEVVVPPRKPITKHIQYDNGFPVVVQEFESEGVSDGGSE